MCSSSSSHGTSNGSRWGHTATNNNHKAAHPCERSGQDEPCGIYDNNGLSKELWVFSIAAVVAEGAVWRQVVPVAMEFRASGKRIQHDSAEIPVA